MSFHSLPLSLSLSDGCSGTLTTCSDSEPPPSKKVKTASVLVEQAGQSDKLLIDQVTDVDSIFDEVRE